MFSSLNKVWILWVPAHIGLEAANELAGKVTRTPLYGPGLFYEIGKGNMATMLKNEKEELRELY